MIENWSFLARHRSALFSDAKIKHKKEKRYLLWNNGGVSVMFWGCFATSGIGCRKSVQNLKTFKGILEQSTPAVPCQKARSQDKDLEPASKKHPRKVKNKTSDISKVAFEQAKIEILILNGTGSFKPETAKVVFSK